MSKQFLDRGVIPRRLFPLLLLPYLLAATAALAPAQSRSSGAAAEAPLQGRVVKGGVGQPGVGVTLHRVTRDTAGVVASTVSGAGGEFAFRSPPADASGFSVYFTTADYLGVRYFGPALHPNDPRADYVVQVYDTATARPGADRVTVARRNLVLVPEPGRGWEVNEILQIRNEEERTLVPGSEMRTWEFRIPEDVRAFEVGESEIAAEEVQRMGGRVFITAPLPPGTRELYIRYRLPDGSSALEIPVEHATASLEFFVLQPAPAVEAHGLTSTGVVTSETESFLRFSATDLAPGQTVGVEWDGPRALPVSPITAAVALAALFLAVGTGAALRRRPAARREEEGERSPAAPHLPPGDAPVP